uniref:MRG domain-containing protein n=1 Tax=Syphacia muris TaxID=451379 RepID=A0A0N5AC04_9BILA
MFNKAPFDVTSEKCYSSLAVVEQKLLEGKKGEEIFIIEEESCEADDTLVQSSSNQDALTHESQTGEYGLNTKVLCCSSDGLYYVAKIIRIEEVPFSSSSPSSLSSSLSLRDKVYTVHYQGWNSRYDEKLPEAVARRRFLPLNEKNLEEANKKIQEARDQQKVKKSISLRQTKDSKFYIEIDNNVEDQEKRTKKNDITGVQKDSKSAHEQPNRTLQSSLNWKLKIKLPACFQDLLVIDMEKIVNGKCFSKLPARYTVDDILEQYAVSGGTNVVTSERSVQHCVQGLKSYFNATLKNRLLYACERKQFEQLYRNYSARRKRHFSSVRIRSGLSADCTKVSQWQPSSVYGFIHLVRLLYKIAEFLEVALWNTCDETTTEFVANSIKMFIQYLEANSSIFFDAQKEYVPVNCEH